MVFVRATINFHYRISLQETRFVCVALASEKRKQPLHSNMGAGVTDQKNGLHVQVIIDYTILCLNIF